MLHPTGVRSNRLPTPLSLVPSFPSCSPLDAFRPSRCTFRPVPTPPLQDDSGSSSDDNPPPPSPMLTAHLRGPQPKKQPAGRGRAFKGRGVRPQTWTEEDGAKAATEAASSPRDGGGGANPSGCEGQRQQQQQQQQQQNQMRLVARNPQDVSTNHDTFLNGQVSPGALSMVSCSTAFSRHSRGGGGAPGDPGFNDSAKHLDTLASMDLARRSAAAAMTAELAPGLGRGAFEDISMSPSIPLRGNDLAGVSKAMPSNAFPAAPVGEVPSLGRRRAALASNAGSSSGSSYSRRSKTSGARPHVLAAQGSRSGPLDDPFSTSPGSDVPSLTVAHAPGKVYQPVVAGGPHHHHKRVGRGTPATHTNGGQHHHRGSGGGGGSGDGTAPFRLPSSIRLTSFGSLASSIVSPQKGSGADWGEHQEQGQGQGRGKQQQADLGEDTSELARRPKVIDMLSTFGSHSYSRSEYPAAAAANMGRSRSSVGEDSSGGGGGGQEKDHQRRRTASSTRRNNKRGDRISQRRSRSSGSQVGGSRRFSSGSIVAESDVRSSRDRRRSASRSMSGGELLVAEEVRSFVFLASFYFWSVCILPLPVVVCF